MMFTNDELHQLQHACELAGRQHAEHAEHMHLVVDALQQGQTVMPFADGQPGADAAKHLADEHERQAQQMDYLHQLIDDLIYQ
jgi:hypothetical protein